MEPMDRLALWVLRCAALSVALQIGAHLTYRQTAGADAPPGQVFGVGFGTFSWATFWLGSWPMAPAEYLDSRDLDPIPSRGFLTSVGGWCALGVLLWSLGELRRRGRRVLSPRLALLLFVPGVVLAVGPALLPIHSGECRVLEILVPLAFWLPFLAAGTSLVFRLADTLLERWKPPNLSPQGRGGAWVAGCTAGSMLLRYAGLHVIGPASGSGLLCSLVYVLYLIGTWPMGSILRVGLTSDISSTEGYVTGAIGWAVFGFLLWLLGELRDRPKRVLLSPMRVLLLFLPVIFLETLFDSGIPRNTGGMVDSIENEVLSSAHNYADLIFCLPLLAAVVSLVVGLLRFPRPIPPEGVSDA